MDSKPHPPTPPTQETRLIQRFTSWYMQQGLLLVVLCFPVILILGVIASIKYFFKGEPNHDNDHL